MKNICQEITGIVLVLILLVSSNVSMAVTQDDINKQKNQESQISNQIDETEEKKKEVQEKKSEAQKQVDTLNSKIDDYEAQIDDLNTQINEANTKIKEEETKLAQSEQDYKEQEELIKKRMVAIYMSGDTSYLDVLLSSKSLTDFISSYYLVSEVTQMDAELLDKIQKQKEEIENAKKEIENSKEKLVTAKSNKENVSTELKTAKSEQSKYVSQLTDEEKELQSNIESLKKDRDSINAEIAMALKSLEESKKNNTANNNSNSSNISKDNTTISKSGFIRPVSGARITCGWYGYAGHTGVDYTGSGLYGKAVVAAKSGTVIISTTKRVNTDGTTVKNYGSDGNYIGNFGSYGEYIVIAHDDGTQTLYAHGKPGSRLVSVGQRVNQGQQIMSVGNTGNVIPRPTQSSPLNGTHLHFEIHINGKAVNPSNYVS